MSVMHDVKYRPFSQPKREVSFLHRPMYDRWFFRANIIAVCFFHP